MYKKLLYFLTLLNALYINNCTSISPSVSISSTASTSTSISMMNTATFLNITYSPNPTTTCNYRAYTSANDFSGTQGANGWYYGYYNSGTFTQFTNYQTTTYTSSLAWNYNVASYGYISANYIMPNGATSCGTPSYGNIAPVLRWYNPIGSCYNDVTIYLSLSPGTTNVVSLTVNGNSIYSTNLGTTYSNYFNAYDVTSIELSVGPLNGNCNAGQTTYSLSISRMGLSISSAASISNTKSPVSSITNIGSRTITNTPKSSVTPNISPSNTQSATSTSTIFYLGNWTDFGQYNYAMADIVSHNDMTIYQCQLNCWLNPLCGLIVVESPCTTISLDSPAIYTTACNVCWLKLTSGWVISASAGSKSIMLYDRIYPPTTTSRTTYSPTASALPTSSVVTYSTLNFCSNTGKTITLPFIGSSTNVMTNAVGGTYGNSWSCNVYINGAGVAQGFLVNITNFNTEAGPDPLRIYNSAGTQIYIYSGNLPNFILYISGTSSIQLLFTTDGSVVGSGVNAIISLVYSSLSGSPSQSTTLSNSPNPSSSPLTSKNVTKSPNPSFSTIRSNTISSSSSQSKTSTVSVDPTDSLRNSRTNIATASATATVFYTGNWTDYGKVYFTGYIQVPSSITINQCMIACWLDPLCGGISVNWGCSDIDLESPQIFTLLCTNCRTIPKATEMDTYPGVFVQHSEWKSFIIYDKIFPPTTSVISSRTPTVSAKPTSSVVTYNTINYCSNYGTSVTLPFIGSTLVTMTNALGGQYTNNLACFVNIYGAGNSQQFRVNITSLNTEGCCDFFTVYNSNNNIVARYSGSVEPGTNFIVSNTQYIRVGFTSDVSSVASGVFATVTLEYSSSSASPSITSSIFMTKSSSNSKSASFSSSSLLSNSPINSVSISNSPIKTISCSLSNSILSTISPTLSSTHSSTPSTISSSTSKSTFSSTHSSTPSIISSSTSKSTLSNNQSSTPSTSTLCSLSPTSKPTFSNSPTPVNLLPFKLPPNDNNYDAAVTSQLNNYLNDLLLNGGTLQPEQALSVINTIPQVGISDTMNVLKKLGGVISAPISFTSTSFEGSLSPIKNTTVEVSSTSYNINVPVIPNLPPNAAVIAISWSNTTKFSNETTLSNIMSISVSNKGVDHSVSNLTTPIVLTWNISDVVTPPNMTLKCSYWNYTSLSWRSDGCNMTIVNNILNCECDHLTDFVARFERVLEMNQGIFANAGNVYSLEGLKKYQNYYIFYGCYFIVMIIIGVLLLCLDITNSEQYLTSLKHNFDIIKLQKEIKTFYIDKCYINDRIDEFDEYNEYKMYKYQLINKISKKFDSSNKNKEDIIKYIHLFVEEELENKHLSDINSKLIVDHDDNSTDKKPKESNICTIISLWWKRLLYQHNYLSILFKYDPQSPRIFRIFFIFTVISHTLFMTAFLYGYSHGLSGEVDESSPIISIVLSIITSIINVPFMNFIMKILQLSGKAEFEWRYPFIYREIKKMIIFEEVYYDKNNMNKDNSSDIIEENEKDEDSIITNFLINYIYRYISCCNKTNDIVKDKDQIFIERIDKEIIKIKDIPQESKCWYISYLPFHTLISTLSFFGCLCYLIWTINYLLLFSANTQSNIEIKIMESFGISQLFSIFIITPITLLFTLLFTWVYHKFFKKTSFASNIIPLYFHSDPFVSEKSFGLTVRLTKSLFLKSIAESSIHQPTDPRIIAPAKGLIAQILKEDISNHMDKDYYHKIIKYNDMCSRIN